MMDRSIAMMMLMLLASTLPMAHAAQDRSLEPFPLIETGERVVATPEGGHPFYTKYINAGGVVIVSSDAVPDAALIAAYRMVLHT